MLDAEPVWSSSKAGVGGSLIARRLSLNTRIARDTIREACFKISTSVDRN